MKRISVCLLVSLLLSNIVFARNNNDSLKIELAKHLKFIDSVENAMQWKTGSVMIANGVAKLNLPSDFKFLDAAQSKFVLHDLWGNPSREDILGMVFPADGGPYADSSFAFILSFEETGFIKDDEADKIDYAEMLSSLQKSEIELNKERAGMGYESMHLVRWAQAPFYDKKRKVLHWAKELKFGTEDDNTLNYDVRVLGRKGILSMNAVAGINNLGMVKANIEKVLAIPEFTAGNKYSDFNSNTDKVAEYGIGALVAGGILAKTGAFALIGKFLVATWKFIAIGFIAIGAWIKKFLAGRRNNKFNSDTSA